MTREDINDIINTICPNDEDYEKPCISPKYLRQELEQLALDQRQWNEESTTKEKLAVDKEQLKTMIRGLTKWYVKKDNTEVGEPNTAVGLLYDDVMFGIDGLPPVTPQEPKTGHWIEEFNDLEGEVRFTCSSCGKYQLFGTDFCYNCGSDNREVEE